MTIKNFKVGQSVFVMGGGRTQRDRFCITEAKVVKIGRKYVTINGNWPTQFKEVYESKPYLIEHVEYGEPMFLFPSREAVDEYIEREELKTWVRIATEWSKIDRYTLAQLREVKRILEEETDDD